MKKRSFVPLIIILCAFAAILILAAVILISIRKRVASMSDAEAPAYSESVPENEPAASEDAETVPDDAADSGTAASDEPDSAGGADSSADETETGGPAADNGDASSSDSLPSGGGLKEAGYVNLSDAPSVNAGDVLIDEKGLSVTLEGLGIDEYGVLAASLILKNSTDREYNVFVTDACVNTYMVDVYAFENLLPGSEMPLDVEFMTADVNMTGITNIGEIILGMEFDDPDSYEPVVSAKGLIRTSDYDVMDTGANDDGYEVGNKDGFRIVARSIEPANEFGKDQWILFYLKNDSSRKAAVVVDELRLNGFESSSTLLIELPPGTQAAPYIFVSGDELESNGISRIDDVSMSAAVYDSELYETLIDFGTVSLSVSYDS